MGVNSCGTTLIDQGFFKNIGAITWDTTVKTSGFTAVSGNGYFCNTTSAAFTVTLPSSPSAGDVVAIADYANTFDTNNVTIGRNGSNIQGDAVDFKAQIEGLSITLIYVDGTQGWLSIDAAQASNISDPEFITATGGTITTSGDYKIHAFTGPGTFTVCSVGNACGSNSIEYAVVGGGGSGGSRRGGGAGAGGFRSIFPSPAVGGLPVSATGYPITVGAGAAPTPGQPTAVRGISGSPSSGFGITSAGGGGGGTATPNTTTRTGIAGGSGGGGAGGPGNGGPGPGAAGNTPPVSPSQGNSGGNGAGPAPSLQEGGGGGGGASASGADAVYPGPGTLAGDGGNGIQIPEVPASYGSPARYFAGGGGGGVDTRGGGSVVGAGGLGGGSRGAGRGTSPLSVSPNAIANTGGGSGGAGGPSCTPTRASGAGGSGIVLIRYKFQ